MKKVIKAVLLTLFSAHAMAENIQTIVYTPTPKMVCEKCEKKIKDNLRFVKGTKKIETSLKDQTISITFDADKAKTDQYVKALAKLGREVKEVSVSDTSDKQSGNQSNRK